MQDFRVRTAGTLAVMRGGNAALFGDTPAAVGIATGATSCGTFSCFANDAYFAAALSAGLLFEQEVVEHAAYLPLVKAARVIVDVGAHCGSHTLMYAHHNPEAVVHAFEPQAQLWPLLRANTARFGDRIHIHEVALGHVAGRVSLTAKACYTPDGEARALVGGTTAAVNLGNVAIHSIHRATEVGSTVPLQTLDALGLDTVDLIKLDVEGAEALVLQGARDTIRRNKPAILFEANGQYVSAGSIDLPPLPHPVADFPGLQALLTSLGYVGVALFNWENILAIHADKLGAYRALVAAKS